MKFKHKQNTRRDYEMWFNRLLFFVLGSMVTLISINVYQYKMQTPMQEEIFQMQRTCEASHKVLSGNLERECGDYIDRLHLRNYAVKQHNGKFWAEWQG